MRRSATPRIVLPARLVRSCASGGRAWNKLDYDAWSAKLLTDQTGFVTPTSWEGETVARFAFLHPDTTAEMVSEILATMR